MAVGKSKRIVIDVDDVDLKRQLHSALAQDGVSLKEWFVTAAVKFLQTRNYGRQLELRVPQVADPIAPYQETPPKEKP